MLRDLLPPYRLGGGDGVLGTARPPGQGGWAVREGTMVGLLEAEMVDVGATYCPYVDRA